MTTPQGRIFSECDINLYWRDNVQLLRAMRPGCIDLVVTSPPYDDLRTYGDGKPSFDFGVIAPELVRVLKPGGVICWNVGDSVVKGSETGTSFRQALAFMALGLRLHDTMIYEKANFSAPSSNRYHQTFEYIFMFSKGKPEAFNALMDRKNINAGKGLWGARTKRQKDGTMAVLNQGGKGDVVPDYGMRTNIWRGNTAGQERPCQSLPHPAMMPKWLARDLITSWSNPGDWVLDPFNGSGTTLEQAYLTARRAVGCDDVRKYCVDAAANLKQVMRKHPR